MWIIVLFLIVVIVWLIIYVVHMKKELRCIVKQMQKKSMIRTKSIDSDVEELAVNINQLYDEFQRIHVDNQKNESEIRRSIANMTHDLRTPLTSIIGYLQLINSDELNKEERDSYYQIIYQRTAHLQDLISSFYDLSRFQSHEFQFDLKRVSLQECLFETLALYYQEFVDYDIEPIIEVDGVFTLLTDEKAVGRIFQNLINNMLKHGEGQIAISIVEEKNGIVSTFKNLAPHLNEQQVSKLFERFYTADASRSDRNTGIGLAITKTLVERLGHEIEARLVDKYLVIHIKWKIE